MTSQLDDDRDIDVEPSAESKTRMAARAEGPAIADLVRLARKGDAAASNALVRRHLRAAFAVALAIVGRTADAEDVAQDAFAVAFERLDECREPARFSGWLIQIVRNRALNALERRKFRDVDTRDDRAERIDDSNDSTSAPDIALRKSLLAGLETLTPTQREVVLLHDLEDWTHGEIAEALGLSHGNCRQHLFAARRALRQTLAALAPDPGE